MTSHQIQFDGAKHLYTVDGRIAPGVTELLGAMGYVPDQEWFTPESRLRGKQAHLARQMCDIYTPQATTLEEVQDVLEVGEALHGYLTGWLLYKREKGFVPEWSERPVYSASLHVAGTPDVKGRLTNGRVAIVDVKSWAQKPTKPKRASVLQVAGYRLLVEECLGEKSDLGVIVALPGDGTYRSFDCEDRDGRDRSLFRCIAYVWGDLKANGLLEE